MILTNTFGANPFMLARHDLADRVAEINAAGVRISREAAAGRAKVFASMGPSGIMLMMGDVSPEDVQAGFETQARAMADAGADAIVVETMSDPAEAKLAVAAAQIDRAAGRRVHGVRLGGEQGPHDDGHHARSRPPKRSRPPGPT